MHSFLKSVVALVALALAALTLAGPAAAWDQHAVAHLAAPVAVDEHHHHDDDGSVGGLHDEGPMTADHSPGDGTDGSGHDHVPSLFAAMSDLPPEGPVVPTCVLEGDRFVPTPTSAPPDLPPTPQIRPPRFA